ncbi:23044_t:CDS:2 [Rhizophagus irregularis]|nr:23044_t:CDS:2 [Rhizophagus irregularis]
MSNNIKDKKVRNNTVSLLFSDNDNIKISAALSFIRNKFQGRLKNISVINDRTAVIIYGKHKDRLMIDLKDNNYYEDLEFYQQKASLVDNASTTSIASNNLPPMSSPTISIFSKPFKFEDYITILNNDLNTINQSIEDDPDQ